MTVSDWLARRTPAPPAELATAIRDALKTRSITSESPSATELLETAQWLLQQVLETECETRNAALHLLTADALVTYALEVANDELHGLGDFPERAMSALAGAGEPSDTAASDTYRGSK